MKKISKGKQIRGKERISLKEKVLDAYESGASIRFIADDLGRSYGFVHGMIAEAGGTFRARGGTKKVGLEEKN